MRLARLCFAIALVSLLGCGGSPNSGQSSLSNTGDDTNSDAPPAEATDEQKIRRAQLGTCGPMCERLVDCSVQDLRNNKSEAEIAEMQLEQLVPRAIDDCNAKCSGATISPRQIRVVQECVNGPEECKDYVTCLDKAQRGSE